MLWIRLGGSVPEGQPVTGVEQGAELETLIPHTQQSLVCTIYQAVSG